MKRTFFHHIIIIITMITLCTLVWLSVRVTAQPFPQAATTRSVKSQAAIQSDSSAPQLIQPEELAKTVQSSKREPLILQVGFHVLYQQAHIPHAEYIGPASAPEGLRQLRKRVRALPHSQAIVLYCGCCPWSKCPNVNPAYQQLHDMGFSNVRVLYIADNFGKDWVDKGYPVARGE